MDRQNCGTRQPTVQLLCLVTISTLLCYGYAEAKETRARELASVRGIQYTPQLYRYQQQREHQYQRPAAELAQPQGYQRPAAALAQPQSPAESAFDELADYEELLTSISELTEPQQQLSLTQSLRAQGMSDEDIRWMMVTHSRRKRNVVQLGDMMRCATGCSPVSYKGYGCYCGFLGSGQIVDGIDNCCYEHDWCYWRADHCFTDPFGVSFYTSKYKWSCGSGQPSCVDGGGSQCAAQLCECDRQFAQCLKRYPCPSSRPICMSSPLRHWQNLFLGLRHGSDLHLYEARHHGRHARGNRYIK